MTTITFTSPPSLQHLTTAAASSWLQGWVGHAGRVAARYMGAEAREMTPQPSYSNILDMNTRDSNASNLGSPNLDSLTLDLNTKYNNTANLGNPGVCVCDPELQKFSLMLIPCTMRSASAQDKKHNNPGTSRFNVLRMSHDYIRPKQSEGWTYKKVQYDNQEECLPSSATFECLKESSALPSYQVKNHPGQSLFKFPENFNSECIKMNNVNISEYLKSHLPPLLLENLIEMTWMKLGLQVVEGEQGCAVPHYQVLDWVKTAPVLLDLAGHLSRRKYSLDVSGIPPECITSILSFIGKKFPLERVNKLHLPRVKYKSDKQISPVSSYVIQEIVEKTSLVSLTLNSNISCDDTLDLISQLSLQELKLDIPASSSSEEKIIKELCNLPHCSAEEAIDAVRTGNFWIIRRCPLGHSLRKLTICIPNVSASVYRILPLVFINLQYYHPSMNEGHCICSIARILRQAECDPPPLLQPLTQLLSINLGRTTSSEIHQLNVACPFIKEISLSVEMYVEETLQAVTLFKQITELDLTYYPSSPTSPPKQDGRLLLPVLNHFMNQLLSLSLTGFNLTERVMIMLSQLPELKSLQLADSWLSSPKVMPEQPFRSLENLTLKILPSDSMIRLLTASSCVSHLAFEFVASEWEGNALTDTHIAHLVSSGIIRSLQFFSATSPFLTLASFKALSLLPFLRSVGHLSLWGLTEEELHCIAHSGPPHIHCIL